MKADDEELREDAGEAATSGADEGRKRVVRVEEESRTFVINDSTTIRFSRWFEVPEE